MNLENAHQRVTDEAVERAAVLSDAKAPDMPIVFVNQAFMRLTGYDSSEIIGRNCRFLQGAETSPDAIEAMRESIRKQISVVVDLLNYRKDGTTFWNRVQLRPMFDENGELDQFASVQRLISPGEVKAEPIFGTRARAVGLAARV